MSAAVQEVASTMPWGPIINSQILAIHAALVPSDDGGEIIYFGGDQHWDQNNIGHEINPQQVDASRRFACRPDASGIHAVMYIRSPTTDVFCSGHAFLADGRLMVCGGTQLFPVPARGGGHGHGEVGHFPGHRNCWVYNPLTREFSEVAPLNPELGRLPGDQLGARTDDIPGGGRWYPTLVTLASGELFVYAGHPRNDDSRHNPGVPERYRPISNSWILLPPTAGAAAGGPDLYPRLFLLKNGQVFCASELQGYGNCTQLDAYTGAVTQPVGLPDRHYHGFGASAVLMPLLPNDGYRSRILVCGGVTAQRLNLEPAGGATPSWRTAGVRHGSAIDKERIHACAVLLPTGQVLITGGVRNPPDQNPEVGVNEPELYTPAIDWASGIYRDIADPNDISDRWETIEEPSPVVRNYHSTALLMPDGRVWTAGSSIRALPGNPTMQGELRISIFLPPYPPGPRPRITDAPRAIAYGQQFTVDTPNAENIARAALLRCGSVTHAFDSDQRYVGLSFTRTSGTRLQVQAPPSGTIAPPGPYMLFLVDNSGRPCEYARFVRVGGELYAFTDRSIIAQDEVQTLLSVATPALLTEAIYVVFDGYLQSDLGLPTGPTITFRWADNGAVVPGLNASIEQVLAESSALGVAQRITLAYNLRFASTAAFGQLGGADQRIVRAEIRLGQLATNVTLQLYRNAVPYMRDGDTPWLSIDLRVIRRKPGEFLAGEPQQSGPTIPDAAHDFLTRVLASFASPARPNDSTHPFERQLEESNGTEGQLGFASHEGGQPVFNYAFAKVRFRAPTTVSTSNLRMLFRLFNTTTPSVAYNPVTIYRRTGSGVTAVPQFYDYSGQPVHSPCFAAPRDPGTHLATTDPLNVRNIAGAGVAEQVVYFGCWLDFNHDNYIRNRLRGDHQCLIAEVHHPAIPIPFGATPSDSSLLAQRNIAFVRSDNPGSAASHTVQHTFELHPLNVPRRTEPQLVAMLVAPISHKLGGHIHDEGDEAVLQIAKVPEGTKDIPANHGEAVSGIATAAAETEIKQQLPRIHTDELLFRWYDLPPDSIVTVYLPDVDLDDLIEFAARRPGPALFERIDDHTLRLRVLGDVTYLPLPPGRVTPIPGLLSVQLPLGVHAGKRYHVTVHHISGLLRRILGAFELNIPVSHGPLILLEERRRLAVLREIQKTITPATRWYPIFERYLKQVTDRVRDFGGDPDRVPPSPYGAPEDRPDGQPGEPPTAGKPGTRVAGKVMRVLFDCRGEIESFILGDYHSELQIHGCSRGLTDLVLRACRDGLTLAVYLRADEPHGVERVEVLCC